MTLSGIRCFSRIFSIIVAAAFRMYMCQSSVTLVNLMHIIIIDVQTFHLLGFFRFWSLWLIIFIINSSCIEWLIHFGLSTGNRIYIMICINMVFKCSETLKCPTATLEVACNPEVLLVGMRQANMPQQLTKCWELRNCTVWTREHIFSWKDMHIVNSNASGLCLSILEWHISYVQRCVA